MHSLDDIFQLLNWDVAKEPISLVTSGKVLPDHRALKRTDTDQVLSVVGSDYVPVQNNEIKEFLRPVVDAGLLIPSHTRDYKDGRLCSATCRLPGDRGQGEVKRGDTVGGGLRVTWGHGGRGITAKPYFLRLVCTNGLTSKHEGRAFRLSHVGSVHDRLKRFERILRQTAHDFERSLEIYSRMAATPISDGQFPEYVKRAYNLQEMQEMGAELASRAQAPDMDEVMGDLLRGHRDQVDGDERREVVEEILRLPRHFSELEHLYHGGAPGSREAEGTVWGAYNALTYYVDHVGGRSEETRAYSADFGPGAALRQRAFNEAVKLL